MVFVRVEGVRYRGGVGGWISSVSFPVITHTHTHTLRELTLHPNGEPEGCSCRPTHRHKQRDRRAGGRTDGQTAVTFPTPQYKKTRPAGSASRPAQALDRGGLTFSSVPSVRQPCAPTRKPCVLLSHQTRAACIFCLVPKRNAVVRNNSSATRIPPLKAPDRLQTGSRVLLLLS